MKLKTGKRRHELAVRTTISMPPPIFEIGLERAKREAFGSFSDYIQALIRADREAALLAHHQVSHGTE